MINRRRSAPTDLGSSVPSLDATTVPHVHDVSSQLCAKQCSAQPKLTMTRLKELSLPKARRRTVPSSRAPGGIEHTSGSTSINDTWQRTLRISHRFAVLADRVEGQRGSEDRPTHLPALRQRSCSQPNHHHHSAAGAAHAGHRHSHKGDDSNEVPPSPNPSCNGLSVSSISYGHAGSPMPTTTLRLPSLEALPAPRAGSHDAGTAAVVLRQLLLPLWRLFRYRKKRQAALKILTAPLKTVARRVLFRLHRGIDGPGGNIFAPPAFSLTAVVELLLQRIGQVQSAYRRHRLQLMAVTELNLRKVRQSEAAYWTAVVKQREAELAKTAATSAVAKAVRELMDGPPKVKSRGGRVYRTPNTALASAARPTYELDVYTYYMIGPLPESLVRYETMTAVFTELQRSAQQACLADQLSTQAAEQQQVSSSRRNRSSPKPGGVARKLVSAKARCPRLLTKEIHSRIIDNTCYISSILRDDAMLRAHLRGRTNCLSVY